MKRIVVPGILTATIFAIFPIGVRAEVFVGQRVKASVPFENIDHSAWHALLRKYVDQDGQVQYQAWHASRDDRQALEQYLARLSAGGASRSTPKAAKLAFWINAYNAVTVHGILREYPTTSIRNHTAKLVGYNIWKHLKLYVGGKPCSLDHMEHKILRKMEEPRIHFAIVCASIGCPRLLNEAYTADALNEQLERNSQDFFSRPQNFRYQQGSVQLSSILDWFGEDFGSNQATQLRTISQWLPTQEARDAATSGRIRVSYLDYDWNLNERR